MLSASMLSASMMSKGEGKRRLPIPEDDDQEDGDFQGLGFGGDENDGDYEEDDEEEEEETQKKKGDSNYKKGTPSSTSRTVYCQAENCSAEMSDAKRYHKRHKVCEFHAKSPHVLVSGIHQRFCQQCSRFHGLPEFDGSKRSCRRRLAGHNERRRKSTSE